jgi:hypothetical protein
MLALCSQFSTSAAKNCRYHDNGHTDDKSTNGEYGILCVGNSITRFLFYNFNALSHT